jgi:hypothetical protein
MKLLIRLMFALPVLAALPAAQAELITQGVYELHNHPDGSAAPPTYGLRLDELFNVSGGHDIFTFDFDHSSSSMFMNVSTNSIDIYGTVYGGLNAGSGYGDPDYVGTWDVDFTYEYGVGQLAGDDDWAADPDTQEGEVNTGTINPTFMNNSVVPLVDYHGGHPFTFRLGDENDDNGHRGFDGISGWGWVNHNGLPHVAASDWLFTAELIEPVPSPSSTILGVFGLVGLAARRNRRTA